MEFEHADRAADAAKEDREQKEMLFRNAALMRLRQALVCAHGDKGGGAHHRAEDKINKKGKIHFS